MSDLLIARHQRVLLLTLNRPQARNALNNALLTQIADALDASGCAFEKAITHLDGERLIDASFTVNVTE